MIKTTVLTDDKDCVISNGLHYLSGIGDAQIKDDFNGGMIDARLFCIDGQTYCVYTNPDDGYRSYGAIRTTNKKCQYTFEPQPILAVNKKVEGYDDNNEGYWRDEVNKSMLVLLDAINHQEVLTIGTDYTEDYYPCAIFDYQPQNMEVNKNR